MSFASSSSLPPSEQWENDVFLSFRGEDTRQTFVAHLYTELTRDGIKTFKDDETLERGASISPQLVSAIKLSRFAIIIFSKNYASSKWCLDELVKIMECRDELGQIVVPVFYDISPSEVRSQRNSFAEAFSIYEEDFSSSWFPFYKKKEKKGDTEKVHKWKKALNEAANLSGHDLHGSTYSGNESRCIEHIVKEIANKLRQKSMISDTLVGAESQIQAASSLLMMECKDVRFIGISGMGGIGKTTIAKAIFYSFSHQFEGACFVDNIKENQAKQGLLSLQKTLLTKVLKIESVNVADEYGGIDMIKKRLGFKKVLVVLDDVDHQDQLDGLAGARDWFGKGSRVIITARNEHLLLDCDGTYKVCLLAIAEATQLFSRHAFRETSPVNGFEQFSHQVVKYAGGLPLALKVLGSFLCGRNMKQWSSALDALRDTPSEEIISKLKISYDGLGSAEKEVFLNFACSFGRVYPGLVKKLFTEIVIDVLVEKSLLVQSSRWIEMHDLIREMGRRIARQECPRRRIWLGEDTADIFTENKGREAIECIYMPPTNSEEGTIHLSNEVFKHMKRLRIFISWSQNNFMHDSINYLPNSLCWLHWSYYPSPSLPKSFEPSKLLCLSMRQSHVVNLWEGSKRLNRLINIDLSGSRELIQIPDLSGSPNLEWLILRDCIRLEEVHPSVGPLKKLICLHVGGCEKLERLPTELQSSLRALHFTGCRSLKKFPEIQQNVNRLIESTLAFEHWNMREILDLSGCSNIETLPSSICRLKTLRFLYLNRCTKIKNLPEDICDLINLEGLDASETSIWCIPNSITRLEKLKFLSFRKVPKFFHESDLCSWGCFAQLDLNFQLPSVLSAACTLTRLDLSACNLVDSTIPEHLGWFAGLVALNLSRNSFTYLPKSIALLNSLQVLDITYCEKLKELPELPPRIMQLFADDRFALQSIRTLPNKYKELYLVSFANQKLQEMWCDSLRGCSGAQMGNCPRESMTDLLEKIVKEQLKLVFDDLRGGRRFAVVFPRSYPHDMVPLGFTDSVTCVHYFSLDLEKHWYTDKFLGFAIYCQFPFLNYGSPKDCNGQLPFSWFLGVTITPKLVSDRATMDHPTLETEVTLRVSDVVTYGGHHCFIFLKFNRNLVEDPNDYCRFELSIDCDNPPRWGFRLVYADEFGIMRSAQRPFRKGASITKRPYLYNRVEHMHEAEIKLCTVKLGELLIPGEIRYFLVTLIFYNNVPVLPTCPRCLSFAEDLSHLFLNCKYSQLVWEGSRLGLNFNVGTPLEFHRWLVAWISSAPENEDLSFSVAVLWAIWQHRNKVVHERAVFVPSEVISTAVKEHSSFPYSEGRAVRELYKACSRTTDDLNVFHVNYHVKDVLVIEVNGAWKEGHEWAGMAWIAYVKDRTTKVAAARRSLKVTSKLHAVVHAFWCAVKWATLQCDKIKILSDNPTFIKELHSSDCCSDQGLVYVLHECLRFMEEKGISWEVVRVPSFAVSEAKKAATKAMKTYIDVFYEDSVVF